MRLAEALFGTKVAAAVLVVLLGSGSPAEAARKTQPKKKPAPMTAAAKREAALINEALRLRGTR